MHLKSQLICIARLNGSSKYWSVLTPRWEESMAIIVWIVILSSTACGSRSVALVSSTESVCYLYHCFCLHAHTPSTPIRDGGRVRGGAKLWDRVLRGRVSRLCLPSKGGVRAAAPKRAAPRRQMTVNASGQIQMTTAIRVWSEEENIAWEMACGFKIGSVL